FPSAQWVKQAEEQVRLEELSTRLLAGEAHTESPSELAQLAEFAPVWKRLHLASAEWLREAFTSDPQLADNTARAYRYTASCAAILGAATKAVDAMSDEDRVAWRKQARDWLTADLAELRKRSESKTPNPGVDFPQNHRSLSAYLSHWLRDSDLAGIRDAE